MKSVMSHSFSNIPNVKIQRSSFNRSHGLKTAFDFGYLVPIYVDEALPGDSFKLKCNHFARLSTPIVPIMDNIHVDIHFFAVPYRLVWDNWEKFNGQRDNPNDSIDYLIPQMVAPPTTGYANQSLSDYLGIPTKVPDLSHSSLWHRAYNLIYNEWYRAQDLQNSVIVDKGDGPDVHTNYPLLKRNKRHDYFTSCLPWPQKGDAVSLPLGDSAPITGLGSVGQSYAAGGTSYETGKTSPTSYVSSTYTGVSSLTYEEDPNNPLYPNIRADLSAATASTVNDIRQAFQIQRMLERDARGGTRYIEVIKSHFGVDSDDARLQRPEYLGGGTSYMNLSPIAQTTPDTTGPDTPRTLASLAAIGTNSNTNQGFVKSFTEHCLLMGIVSARVDLNYQQGLDRKFSRKTRYDFYWPSLANLGEQSVLNKEIYAQGTATDDLVFGYQERYAEYRYFPSKITGKFRSNDAQSIDYWHLAQDFANLPVLNDQFIQEAPPIDRSLAYTDEPEILFDSYFEIVSARPMPTYSVPGMIDHF